jgi:hypothetical protein
LKDDVVFKGTDARGSLTHGSQVVEQVGGSRFLGLRLFALKIEESNYDTFVLDVDRSKATVSELKPGNFFQFASVTCLR